MTTPTKQISRYRTYRPLVHQLKLLVCTIAAAKSGSGVSAKSSKIVPCRPLTGSRKFFLNKDELTPGTNRRHLPTPSFRPIAMSDGVATTPDENGRAYALHQFRYHARGFSSCLAAAIKASTADDFVSMTSAKVDTTSVYS